MKKIIILVFLVVGLYLYSYDEVKISDDSIRFRVIANSNSAQDQSIKLKVRNSIQKTTTELLKNTTNNITAIKNFIFNNIKLQFFSWFFTCSL